MTELLSSRISLSVSSSPPRAVAIAEAAGCKAAAGRPPEPAASRGPRRRSRREPPEAAPRRRAGAAPPAPAGPHARSRSPGTARRCSRARGRSSRCCSTRRDRARSRTRSSRVNELSRYLANAGDDGRRSRTRCTPTRRCATRRARASRRSQTFTSASCSSTGASTTRSRRSTSRRPTRTRSGSSRSTLRDYKRAGVALDEPQRARIKEIDDETTKLGQQIQKNIAEDTRCIEVTDPARLAGLPADWIAAHKPGGRAASSRSSTDYPDYIPFVTYADDDALRKELYIKFRSRGDKENEAALAAAARAARREGEAARLQGLGGLPERRQDAARWGKAAAQFIERDHQARAGARREGLRRAARAAEDDRSEGDRGRRLAEGVPREQGEEGEVRGRRGRGPQVLRRTTRCSRGCSTSRRRSTTCSTSRSPTRGRGTPTSRSTTSCARTKKLGRIFLDMHPRADKYKHAAQFTIVDGVHGQAAPRGRAGVQLPEAGSGERRARADGARRRGHDVPRVRPPPAPRARRPAEVDPPERASRPSTTSSRRRRRCSRSGAGATRRCRGSRSTTRPARRSRRSWSRRCAGPSKFGLGTQTAQQMFYAAISLAFHQADPSEARPARDGEGAAEEVHAVRVRRGHAVPHVVRPPRGLLVDVLHVYVVARDREGSTDAVREERVAGDRRSRTGTATRSSRPGGTKDAADLVKDFLGRKYDFKAFERFLSSE